MISSEMNILPYRRVGSLLDYHCSFITNNSLFPKIYYIRRRYGDNDCIPFLFMFIFISLMKIELESTINQKTKMKM